MRDLHAFEKPPCIPISKADRNGFFTSGLEYNTPARGMWNIVHTGMLVPEAHQIFVCAQGCLRGVIMTAGEMNELSRMSWVSVDESDMYDGTIEQKVIDGTAEILNQFQQKPPIVLLFLSCIHFFAGCDFRVILDELSAQFPEITFVDCYMTPTMRQTVSPAVQMAQQLYSALKPLPLNPKAVNIVGNDRPTYQRSELWEMLRGLKVRDITTCATYEDYLQMAESSLNISYLPLAYTAGEYMKERFGSEHLYLPMSFDFDTINENYHKLCQAIGKNPPAEEILSRLRTEAENQLQQAFAIIGNTPIAIDFTAVPRPFELAKLLCEHGFNVKAIIADSVPEEEKAFELLKINHPDLLLYSATNVNMLNFCHEEHEHYLAIGQKASYYFSTDNFVNIVGGGGYYGYRGIGKIARLMQDAFQHPKDRRAILRHKGIGCESCLEKEVIA
ncbi:MAG: nitrogenase component 1 [Oscillospiraceae bacterium]